jgi:sulfate/thiosulfate transport system permease protein
MPAAAGALATVAARGQSATRLSEPAWLRVVFIGVALLFVALFLVVPLALVFAAALENGLGVYVAALTNSDSLHAIALTLLAAAVSVPAGALFGLAAAWAITRFQFAGKNLLITLIDLPFSVSPVIAGMLFVVLFSPTHGYFALILNRYDIQIIFAVPGVIIATMFVTFPFVARELIPLMEAQGTEEEQAARVLGASGWQIFWRITLPNAKWGLLYGIILCNARAMGEFGAVSVVTMNVQGFTNTIPLEVKANYDAQTPDSLATAFAVASLLALLGLVTLVAKSLIEWRVTRQRKEQS